MSSDTYMTPPAVARELNVGLDKVYLWIANGELKAVNLAAKRSGRARWKVSRQALAEFLASRESGPVVTRQRRRRFEAIPKDPNWIDYV